MHIPGSAHLRPSIQALLRALDIQTHPPQCQKAITPMLLKTMFELAGTDLVPLTKDTTIMSIAAKLAIMAFFALRHEILQVHHHTKAGTN